VIIAAFSDPDRAGAAMDEIKAAKSEGLIGIIDMAIVVKDSEGKLKITNAKHRGTRGFITGGVVGGLVGLLAGPVGWAALGGGAIGALAGKARGAPMKAEITEIGEQLVPNASAIVAVIEHSWVADLQRELAARGARVVQDELNADIAEQLQAGGNVLYSTVASDAGAAGVRATSLGGTSEATAVVSTDDAVLIEHATLTDEQLPDGGGEPATAGAPGGSGSTGGSSGDTSGSTS
jgi:uncharacterized membrane protein